MMHAFEDFRRLVAGPRIDVGNRDARVVAIAARTGGVGKTTTTVNLGAGLALFHKRKVLLLDMDAQGHVDMCLRVEGRGRAPDTLSRVLLGKRRDVFEIVQPTTIDGLWYVASDPGLNQTEGEMASRIGKELLLRQAIKAARSHFDVVLCDCPPNLGSLTVNALVAADAVLVPTDLSTLSLDGVDALLDTVDTVRETLNPGLGVLGVLRTRVDKRNQTMNTAITEALTSRYGPWVLDTEIGVSTAIAKAQHAGRPVLLDDADSRGSDGYRTLAAEVDRRLFGR